MKKFIIVVLICVLGSFSFSFADEAELNSSELLDFTNETVVNDLQLEAVNLSVQRVSANDSTGFKRIMLQLLGDYETVVTDYTYNNGSYTSHSISIERDWSWICSCCVFGLVVYCVFRLIGLLWGKI